MAVFACGQRLMNRMFQRFCHTVERIVCNGCLLLHKKHYIVKTFFFINDKFLHFYTWFFNAALQKKNQLRKKSFIYGIRNFLNL